MQPRRGITDRNLNISCLAAKLNAYVISRVVTRGPSVTAAILATWGRNTEEKTIKGGTAGD